MGINNIERPALKNDSMSYNGLLLYHFMNKADESYMFHKGFENRGVIGSGGNGTVYLVYDPAYKQEFAVKSIPSFRFHQNEVKTMEHIDNSAVVRLYFHENYMDQDYLIMEYCPQSLSKYLEDRNVISNTELIYYASEIIKAVRHLHLQGIVHLDIKPANILIDSYNRIRLCDFGLSSSCTDFQTKYHFGGSVPFMAPEILNMKEFDPKKADIWAIGVTLFIMAAGCLPWEGRCVQSVCNNVLYSKPKFDMIPNQELVKLISKCLDMDPDERPTIDQLASSPLFRQKKSISAKKLNHFSILSNGMKRGITRSSIIKPELKRFHSHM